MPPGVGMRQGSDFKASLVFLSLGVWACIEANRLGFGSIRAPEPGFFPWLGGLALSGLSLGLFAETWRGRGTGSPGKPQKGEWARPAILTGVLLLYVPLLEPIGYPVATAALCVVALWILGARRWAITVWVSAALAVGSFLLFRRLLGVELPAGVLAFLG